MDDALRDLYQDVIVSHTKNPHNRRAMPSATHEHEGYNPLCGDRVTVHLKVEAGRIADVAWEGAGCAISTSSVSLMTDALRGKTLKETDEMWKEFQHLILRDGPADETKLGKLKVFFGVGEFPARVKCATLCWHTMRAALAGTKGTVKTE